jgi:5-methylcytosine-specific restriction endonuclease McrA
MNDGGSRSWQERRWRRARLYKLGLRMEDYETKYLFSEHWSRFRNTVLETQRASLGRNICERCPEGANQRVANELHIHHLTYERLGEERLEDVEVLCRDCHDKIHLRDQINRARHRAPGYER